MAETARLIGLMSGTSLDGVDAVLVEFSPRFPAGQQLASHYLPYPAELRTRLLALHQPGHDELHRAACLANELSTLYARCAAALQHADRPPIAAIACHGQTIRHRPDCGYTLQLVNAALLAELSGTRVIADFRSRDIAAGGQGAPLVPAFHAAAFHHPGSDRAVVNIGGIANLTRIAADGTIGGFDCGPGNMLLDAWCARHTGHAYDRNGAWGASGQALPVLLERLLAHPFFTAAPPKSAGREQFNLDWLDSQLDGHERPQDVQATLTRLTAYTIARALQDHCPATRELYVCGGGAHNDALTGQLQEALPAVRIALTDTLGYPADWLEAHAFAWLGWKTLLDQPGNRTEVTGARHPCILGAIHPR